MKPLDMEAYLVFIIQVLELHPSVWLTEIDTFQFINRAIQAQASGNQTCLDEYTRRTRQMTTVTMTTVKKE